MEISPENAGIVNPAFRALRFIPVLAVSPFVIQHASPHVA